MEGAERPAGASSLLPPPKRRQNTQDDRVNGAGPSNNQWRATAKENLKRLSQDKPKNVGQGDKNSRRSGGGGRKNNASGPFQQPPPKPETKNENGNPRPPSTADFAAVLELLKDQSENQVVNFLADTMSKEFETFIRGRLALKDFTLLLQILRIVCSADHNQNKSLLLNQVCHPDLISIFSTMLVEAASESGLTFDQVASDMIFFFSNIVTMLPLVAAGLKSSVQSCFSSIKGICSQGGSVTVSKKLIDDYASVLKDVKALELKPPPPSNNAYLKNNWQDQKKEQLDKLKYAEPPNHFREISIYPTREDLMSPHEPFLRPNIVDGQYLDVEHYLDIQFRLLREDFVRPLREGIQDKLNNTDRRKCEAQGVKFYEDIKFINYVREKSSYGAVLKEGVLLCFDTTGKKFQKTTWEHSKKFMHGALVCFTCNNFKTVLFATVSCRDLKYLKERRILVSFCEDYKEDIYNANVKYTMVESEAFFEPYNQVLQSLKHMDEANFPMKDYLIYLEKYDRPPKYIQNEHFVDFRGEIISSPETTITGIRNRRYTLTILDPQTWPTPEELGLDGSQYQALQAALTKELVVIQGPPGTGKTYMALKIAEILFRNKKHNTPILVVCLTNHALDQFLVGILKFTRNLVRIGGQSKCKELEEFNLKNQPQIKRSRYQINLLNSITQRYKELENAEARLKSISSSVQNVNGSIQEDKLYLEERRKNILDDIAERKGEVEMNRREENANRLRCFDVIGLTTTGGARNHKLLNSLGCEIVIVEEAAEVLESHVVACISKSCNQLILIGDHKQLRPSVSVYELEQLYDLDVSLFERLVTNRENCVTLQVQHRMAPEMARLLVPTIYEKLEDHESVLGRPNVLGVAKRLYFKNHCQPEQHDRESSSRINDFEANFLIALSKRLLKHEYKPSQITILTTYKGQMFHLKNKIKRDDSDALNQVYVTTVDDYQGEENDIILLSLVRSNPEMKIGFLATENRVCVALSRAKQGFFIVGNMDMLSSRNQTWKAIKKSLQEQDAVGNSLPLRCEVHREQMFGAAHPNDFVKLAPYDGCNKICDEVLNCRHLCNTVCHLMHFDHSKIKCQAPCERLCDGGLHGCKLKCHVDCGYNCNIEVIKDLPCGHKATLKCKDDPRKYSCKVIVEKFFNDCLHTGSVPCGSKVCPNPCDLQVDCGHSCTKKCHVNSDPDHVLYRCEKPCAKLKKNCSRDHACQKLCHLPCNLCEEKVTKQRSCGHSYDLKCHENPEAIVCNKKCKITLECGHLCTKRCSENCHPCLQKVEKIRSCGHKFILECHKSPERHDCLYDCTKTLDCGHECANKCFERCAPCLVPTMKIIPSCGHTAEVPCHRKPLQADCTDMCERILKNCGHPCRAKCADTCGSVLCQEIVTTIGSCGHEIECFCFEKQIGKTVDERCTTTCGTTLLQCGHVCSGNCHTCWKGRFHVPCKEICSRILICGHTCESICGIPCPPCNGEKTIHCEHGERQILCSSKKINFCENFISYECPHNGIKYETCSQNNSNTRLCKNQPCPKTLECGHNCLGLCGELCPPVCLICSKNTHLFSNLSMNKAPRIIMLPKCKHIFEQGELEMWFQWQESKLELKVCPTCKFPVSSELSMNLKQTINQTYIDCRIVSTSMDQSLKSIDLHQLSMLIKSYKNSFSLLGSRGLISAFEDELWLANQTRNTLLSCYSKASTYKIKVEVIGYLKDLLSNFPSDHPSNLAVQMESYLILKLILHRERREDVLWLQQIHDLQTLLETLRDKAKDLPSGGFIGFFKTLFSSIPKSFELSTPQQMLKGFWLKCLPCNHIQFCPQGVDPKCLKCRKTLLLQPPLTLSSMA